MKKNALGFRYADLDEHKRYKQEDIRIDSDESDVQEDKGDERNENYENVDGQFETEVIGELPSLPGNAEQDVLYLLNDALKFQAYIMVDT